ncbi:hypothetical protein [Parafrankia discariae]|uniref:hypothetical protein n=1 Tax=Parafrankia discariae TaxID=365528 RepID=UPI000478391E|nr:hypothetical protein [Parafrankia discariae]
MTVARSFPVGRAGLVAVLIAGMFALTGQTAARAGGTPAAECPGGQEFEIATTGDEPDPGPPVRLEDGYYAQTAAFWPPRSAVLCRTESGTDQPSAEVTHTPGLTCPSGTSELVVPDVIPTDYETPVVADSGALLPAGWYSLPSLDPESASAGTQPTDPAAPVDPAAQAAPVDLAGQPDPATPAYGSSTDQTALTSSTTENGATESPATESPAVESAGTEGGAAEVGAFTGGGAAPDPAGAGPVSWTTVCWSQTDPGAPAA